MKKGESNMKNNWVEELVEHLEVQLEGLKSRVCKNTTGGLPPWCLFCPFSIVGHDDNEICTIQHTIDKLDGMIERAEGV